MILYEGPRVINFTETESGMNGGCPGLRGRRWMVVRVVHSVSLLNAQDDTLKNGLDGTFYVMYI